MSRHRYALHSGRRAFTLIELVAVLGTAALVALMATSILFAMLQQHATLRRSIQIASSHARLGGQFRADVQRARAVELADTEISLSGPAGIVRYQRVAPRNIRRTLTVDGTSRADDYEVTDGCELAFTTNTIHDRQLVTLSLSPPTEEGTRTGQPSTSTDSYSTVTILAELARDYRWQSEVNSQ